MPYVLLHSGTAERRRCKSFKELLQRYDDMYKYSVLIAGPVVYIVVKSSQPPTPWEHGWVD